jgi:hypothetical protein
VPVKFGGAGRLPCRPLIPGKTLVTQLEDLLCRGGMSGSAAATHDNAGPAKLIAHRGRRAAQLRSNLAQSPTLGVQVGCTLNVHRDTVTTAACRRSVGKPRCNG